jgi:hypothetical protein
MVEYEPGKSSTAEIVLHVGDMLLIRSSGVRIGSGATSLHNVGAFVRAALADDGTVIEPAGAPNRVVLLALAEGKTTLEFNTGDPYRQSARRTVTVRIEE